MGLDNDHGNVGNVGCYFLQALDWSRIALDHTHSWAVLLATPDWCKQIYIYIYTSAFIYIHLHMHICIYRVCVCMYMYINMKIHSSGPALHGFGLAATLSNRILFGCVVQCLSWEPKSHVLEFWSRHNKFLIHRPMWPSWFKYGLQCFFTCACVLRVHTRMWVSAGAESYASEDRLSARTCSHLAQACCDWFPTDLSYLLLWLPCRRADMCEGRSWWMQ